MNNRTKDSLFAAAIIGVLLAVGFGACGAWNQWLYDDWTCVFKHCRDVKGEPCK